MSKRIISEEEYQAFMEYKQVHCAISDVKDAIDNLAIFVQGINIALDSLVSAVVEHAEHRRVLKNKDQLKKDAHHVNPIF